MSKLFLMLATLILTISATFAGTANAAFKCETADACLDLETSIFKSVVVTPQGFCGEVDPYYIGDSCTYNLQFSDGTDGSAWIIGTDVPAGTYNIKYLPSNGQVSDLGLGVFKILP